VIPARDSDTLYPSRERGDPQSARYQHSLTEATHSPTSATAIVSHRRLIYALPCSAPLEPASTPTHATYRPALGQTASRRSVALRVRGARVGSAPPLSPPVHVRLSLTVPVFVTAAVAVCIEPFRVPQTSGALFFASFVAPPASVSITTPRRLLCSGHATLHRLRVATT